MQATPAPPDRSEIRRPSPAACSVVGPVTNAAPDSPWRRRTGVGRVAAALAVMLAAACATPPRERFTPPPEGAPAAEVELRLMSASRQRSAGFYVRGAASCNPSKASTWLNRTLEAPPLLVAGSWEGRHHPVARLPAGEPLGLRFRYEGPGEAFEIDWVVVLEPGRRYVLEHEIPGTRASLRDAATGQPPRQLPVRHFHAALNCPA